MRLWLLACPPLPVTLNKNQFIYLPPLALSAPPSSCDWVGCQGQLRKTASLTTYFLAPPCYPLDSPMHHLAPSHILRTSLSHSPHFPPFCAGMGVRAHNANMQVDEDDFASQTYWLTDLQGNKVWKCGQGGRCGLLLRYLHGGMFTVSPLVCRAAGQQRVKGWAVQPWCLPLLGWLHNCISCMHLKPELHY